MQTPNKLASRGSSPADPYVPAIKSGGSHEGFQIDLSFMNLCWLIYQELAEVILAIEGDNLVLPDRWLMERFTASILEGGIDPHHLELTGEEWPQDKPQMVCNASRRCFGQSGRTNANHFKLF